MTSSVRHEVRRQPVVIVTSASKPPVWPFCGILAPHQHNPAKRDAHRRTVRRSPEPCCPSVAGTWLAARDGGWRRRRSSTGIAPPAVLTPFGRCNRTSLSDPTPPHPSLPHHRSAPSTTVRKARSFP